MRDPLIVDIAKNPRISQLLGRIDESRRRVADLPEGSAERKALEREMDGFYAEAGRYVHWLMRQDPDSVSRVMEESRRWAQELDARQATKPLPDVPVEEISFEELPDDEATDVTGVSVAALELTGDSRGEGVDVRALQDIEGAPNMPVFSRRDEDAAVWEDEQEDADFGALESGALESIGDEDSYTDAEPLALGDEISEIDELAFDDDDDDSHSSAYEEEGEFEDDDGGFLYDADPGEDGVSDVAIAVRTGSFEVPTEDPVPPPEEDNNPSVAISEDDWLSRLRELLDVLGPPEPLSEDGGEVRMNLVRATTNLELRWSVYPSAVQQALLGLTGARARRLQDTFGDDADVRLAVGRMKRFAADRDLLVVPSLRDRVGTRDWFSDERRYWAVLRAGM